MVRLTTRLPSRSPSTRAILRPGRLASQSDARFEPLSAVTAGVKEIRAVVERARHERRAGRRTLLFLDELHRLNRAQQDALLPHVEAGTVTLIGATTENPSFEVIAPLLSRCRVFTLAPLAHASGQELLDHAHIQRVEEFRHLVEDFEILAAAYSFPPGNNNIGFVESYLFGIGFI